MHAAISGVPHFEGDLENFVLMLKRIALADVW